MPSGANLRAINAMNRTASAVQFLNTIATPSPEPARNVTASTWVEHTATRMPTPNESTWIPRYWVDEAEIMSRAGVTSPPGTLHIGPSHCRAVNPSETSCNVELLSNPRDFGYILRVSWVNSTYNCRRDRAVPISPEMLNMAANRHYISTLLNNLWENLCLAWASEPENPPLPNREDFHRMCMNVLVRR